MSVPVLCCLTCLLLTSPTCSPLSSPLASPLSCHCTRHLSLSPPLSHTHAHTPTQRTSKEEIRRQIETGDVGGGGEYGSELYPGFGGSGLAAEAFDSDDDDDGDGAPRGGEEGTSIDRGVKANKRLVSVAETGLLLSTVDEECIV